MDGPAEQNRLEALNFSIVEAESNVEAAEGQPKADGRLPQKPRLRKHRSWPLCVIIVVLSIASAIVGFCLWAKRRDNSGYDETRAKLFARLAGAAYCTPEQLKSWSCGEMCDGVSGVSDVAVCDTHAIDAFVAMWDGACIVSFQGTDFLGKPLSAVTDLYFPQTKEIDWIEDCPECAVSWGFLSAWQNLRPCVKEQLMRLGCLHSSDQPQPLPVRVTGHSLGAAVGTLAMHELVSTGAAFVTEAYDFGRPRVGNAAFTELFNAVLHSVSWRVTHARDPVPHIPWSDMGFKHFSSEAFYHGALTDGYELCTGDEDFYHCAGQYWWTNIWINDHLRYLDMAISACTGGEVSVRLANASLLLSAPVSRSVV